MKRFFRLLVASFALVSVAVAAEPTTFQNPILPGYHPDPSICRVGEDYYLVNSTFEWFPGVPIYHSRDLVNWKQIGNILERPSQLMMPAEMNHNMGIWAPTIRYHEGKFYMVTTAMGCGKNFFVTADRPEGPWSDPIWVKEAFGIDPTLFWDDNGECWYLGSGGARKPRWDTENDVFLAKIDLETGKFISEIYTLTHGHAINAIHAEGPHLYKIDGKYLLLVAEGGTGPNHSVTVFQSDEITGPYEPSHINPVFTHRHLGMEYPVHSVGHADLVETQSGEWWSVMLAKRSKDGCLLARETYMSPVTIEKGIPIYNKGVGRLKVEERRPNLPWTPVEGDYGRDEFDGDKLGFQYCCVRTPLDQWWSIAKGALTLYLKSESFSDFGTPAYWGRRVEAYEFDASTRVKFTKAAANEEAGVVLYRTRTNYLSLTKMGDDIVVKYAYKSESAKEMARVKCSAKEVVLRLEAKASKVQCYFGTDEDNLQKIGEPLNLDVVSDKMAGGFNGPFVGVGASANGKASKKSAQFEYFEYNQ